MRHEEHSVVRRSLGSVCRCCFFSFLILEGGGLCHSLGLCANRTLVFGFVCVAYEADLFCLFHGVSCKSFVLVANE